MRCFIALLILLWASMVLGAHGSLYDGGFNEVGFVLRSRPEKVAPVYAMASGDLDGDGRLEIVYKQQGDVVVCGTDFAELRRFRAGTSGTYEQLVLHDLDGDGRLEILTCGRLDERESHFFRIFTWDGKLVAKHYARQDSTPVLRVEDLDDDGLAEVVVGTGHSSTIDYHVLDSSPAELAKRRFNLVRRNDARLVRMKVDKQAEELADRAPLFSLDEKQRLVIAGVVQPISGGRLLTFDFDGDGSFEVLYLKTQRRMTAMAPTLIALFTNDGKMLWSHEVRTRISDVEVVDLDGDGWKELIVVGLSLRHFHVYGKPFQPSVRAARISWRAWLKGQKAAGRPFKASSAACLARLEKAALTAGSDANVLVALAMARYAQKDYVGARKVLERTIGLRPLDGRAHFYLYKTAVRLRDRKLAREQALWVRKNDTVGWKRLQRKRVRSK